MKTVGTLKELNVKPGDVVRLIGGSKRIYTIDRIVGGEIFGDTTETPIKDSGYLGRGWKLISRATDTPTLWRDMTPEEKGALLLAHHEGKGIEIMSEKWVTANKPTFHDVYAYRIKPEPKRPHEYTIDPKSHIVWVCHKDGLIHVREVIDGKPDPASIKMEEL